jgi:hypothetical protein
VRRLPPFACALALLAGCGGSDHARVPPEAMLDSAAAHPVRSAQARIEARVRAKGSGRLSEPITVRLEGPYRVQGARLPSFDWRLSLSALGFPVGGRLISTGANVYLSVYGNQYQVGEEAVAGANARLAEARDSGHLALRPRRWLGRARVSGRDSAGGLDCERIAAPLRGGAIVHDLAPLADALGVSVAAVSGRATACVGFDDRVLHGLELDATVHLAAGEAGSLDGARELRLEADLELSDVGEAQSITAPRGAHRPIQDLLLTLRDLGVPIP